MTDQSVGAEIAPEILEAAISEALSETTATPSEVADAVDTLEPVEKTRSTRQLVTAGAIAFSFTLLAGSFAVTMGIVPLRGMSAATRVDLSAMLMFAPVCALVLALLFEVTRLALRAPQEIPEPRAIRIDWEPGTREG